MMNPDTEYIEVAVALPVFQTFTYGVPESMADLAAIGHRVLVQFGRRRITGYVLGPGEGVDNKEVKAILDILDEQPLFPPDMVPFFRWISDYYKYPPGEVIKNALPGGLIVRDTALISITSAGEAALDKGSLDSISRQILGHVRTGSCLVRDLYKKIEKAIPGAHLHSLEQQGLIARQWKLSRARTRARLERFVQLADPFPDAAPLSRARANIIDVLAGSGEISVR